MVRVPIIVLEDTAFPKDRINLPITEGEFEFILHGSFGEWIRSSTIFKRWRNFVSGPNAADWPSQDPWEADQEWEHLSGPVIIVFDLALGLSSEKEVIKEVDDYVGKWIGSFGGEPDQKQGLYLIGRALRNKDWHGVIVIATTSKMFSVRRAQEALESIFDRDDVVVILTEDAINVFGNENAVVGEGIKTFLNNFGTIEGRLWPDYTENWFPTSDSSTSSGSPADQAQSYTAEMPHDCPDDLDSTDGKRCKKKVLLYLKSLLLFDPPDDWFQNDQFKHLYNDLKYLIGSSASVQGGGDRNVTLGNMVLLLAAVIGNPARSWLENITWTKRNSRKQILPPQEAEGARKAILDLVAPKTGLFGQLAVHEVEKTPLVVDVNLTETKLIIMFNFDASEQLSDNEGRPTLIEKVESLKGDGGVFSAYRNFLAHSARHKESRGRRAESITNLYTNEQGKTCLEFVSLKHVFDESGSLT